MDAQWFAAEQSLAAGYVRQAEYISGWLLSAFENTGAGYCARYLQDVVLLSWNKETNTLTVRFNNGLTADRWKSIYTGGGKRDFAALYYTFIYIERGQRPDYWTWVDGSEKAIDAVIAEAGTKANYDPNDRGITNGIYVARFQNDGEIMALPGNTSL